MPSLSLETWIRSKGAKTFIPGPNGTYISAIITTPSRRLTTHLFLRSPSSASFSRSRRSTPPASFCAGRAEDVRPGSSTSPTP